MTLDPQGLRAIQAVLERTMLELDRIASELQGLRGQLAITVRVVKEARPVPLAAVSSDQPARRAQPARREVPGQLALPGLEANPAPPAPPATASNASS